MAKRDRISYHVPGDLVPIVRELAERDDTPPSKWLGELIRKELRERRGKLLNYNNSNVPQIMSLKKHQ
ncbi:MAG: hypothetical protein MET45_20935 [Nostoc sp. LLA-1]|nr:hypothetical protein [Cyanocohniella sp. LLY]